MKYLFALLALACACAQAATDVTDNGVNLEKYVRKTTVQADGSFVQEVDVVTHIIEERAIAGNAQANLSYNRGLSKLEVIEAYTLKANGAKLPVTPDNIKDQNERASGGAPMFQDSRTVVIVFPQLAKGDRTVYQYRLTQHTPMYPKQFLDSAGHGFHKIGDYRLIYDLPASMVLHADVAGYKASRPSAAPGRAVYQWEFEPGANYRIESGSVAYADYGRRLFVSTFDDFAGLAKAYDARSSDKTVPDAAVSSLAKDLTDKLSDPRAKAYAINDWVRKNIRYVAVYIGAGGVVPHAAPAILANRYGDCKDHTVLMEALLDAAGIPSTPALINLGTSFKLPSVPLTFNHVITYVPGLDLFLDSTGESVAAGYLPQADLDKAVLLTKSGKMGRTPASQVSSIESTVHYKIDAQGAASFSSTAWIGGAWSEPVRFSYRNIKEQDRARIVEDTLKGLSQRGKGSVFTQDAPDRPGAFQINTQGRSEDMLSLPGPVGMTASSSFNMHLSSNVFAYAAEKTRTQDFVCYASDFKEEARYTLDRALQLMAMPKPLQINEKAFAYRSDYRRDGDDIVVTRRFTVNNPSAVCSAKEYMAMRPSLEKMLRDLKAQIIVQAP